jgi:hypothetical protein
MSFVYVIFAQGLYLNLHSREHRVFLASALICLAIRPPIATQILGE